MAATQKTALGLSAVIVAVTNETPRVLVVRRVTHELAAPAQKRLEPRGEETTLGLPFGPFQPEIHRTLELGLRCWVEELAGFKLRYVEQLYTFGDRNRDPRELFGGPRVVSVGYLALVREAPLTGTGDAEWCNWYDFLPWEDWREGRPAFIDRIIRPRLGEWAESAPTAGEKKVRAARLAQCFSEDDDQWDIERTLDRYELLYEARMLPEVAQDEELSSQGRDGGRGTATEIDPEIAPFVGRPMVLDNRRILASAMGRLRGKLRYRPLVFELLPSSFTLLQLQRVVEAMAGKRLHKQNFRRLLQTAGLVEATGQFDMIGRGRPAELFRFRHEVLRERIAPGVGIPTVRMGS